MLFLALVTPFQVERQGVRLVVWQFAIRREDQLLVRVLHNSWWIRPVSLKICTTRSPSSLLCVSAFRAAQSICLEIRKTLLNNAFLNCPPFAVNAPLPADFLIFFVARNSVFFAVSSVVLNISPIVRSRNPE